MSSEASDVMSAVNWKSAAARADNTVRSRVLTCPGTGAFANNDQLRRHELLD